MDSEEDISYNVIEKKIENNDIKIRKAICDETGLNLLVESNKKNFQVRNKSLIKNDEANKYYIENLDQEKKIFVVNMYEKKEINRITIEIECDGKTNEYEIVKK